VTPLEPELHGEPAAAAAPRGWHRWLLVYQLHMPRSPRRERLFLAALAFFLTFALTRGLTLAIRHNLGPFHNVSVGGTHLHHLVWGILLLLLVGYGSLVEFGSRATISGLAYRLTAVAFGIGAALTLDEFALWLNLQDVYWEEKGRESIDAVLVFGSLLAAGILGQPLLQGLAWEARAALRGVSEAERIAHTELERILPGGQSPQGEGPHEPVDGPP
jgi:hypothetical protein